MKIEFTPRAKSELDNLSVNIADRIVDKLIWIAEHPEVNVKRLAGMPPHLEGLLKYRVGVYRILFWFDNDIITVYRVSHRSTVYRGLK